MKQKAVALIASLAMLVTICVPGTFAVEAAELSMFERLMACETYDELSALLDNMTDEDFATFSEEEIVQILEKNTALEPSPLPSIGEGTADVPADEPVISEIIYPTVNFDNVAHFGAPVEG